MDLGESLRNFAVATSNSVTNAVSLSDHMTLRNICIKYRDAEGSTWIHPKYTRGDAWLHTELPESNGSSSMSEIPCMNRFRNIVGHVDLGEIICFRISRTNSISDMVDVLSDLLLPALQQDIPKGRRRCRLWSIPETVRYKFTGEAGTSMWREGNNTVPSEHAAILNMLAGSLDSPLSANTTHAAMEADHFNLSDMYGDIFCYPHNAAISVGLIGSLNDNQCIDMSCHEEKNNIDTKSRSYESNFIGFICAGHTSHSTEAGKVRRVASSVSIRLLTEETILTLSSIAAVIDDTHSHNKDWTVFCMGLYCVISESELMQLCRAHRILSQERPTCFSLHIDSNSKIVNISISSGTLLKQASNGYWVDNIEVYRSSHLKYNVHPRIDTKGRDQHRSCFSTFFSLVPYISSDRAPRPLISSVQLPQAVCLPWCPGNAAVSPCYTFDPLVTTPLYHNIMQDIDNNSTAEHRPAHIVSEKSDAIPEVSISNYIPGENVMCLFLNMEYNYEDAIMVSKRYIDMGGFSTTSICSYILPQTEYIPPVGATMCSKLSRWWKSPCQKYCTHKINDMNQGNRYTVGYKPTGVVHDITNLNTGEINVKVRSHQPLQSGDKLSMGHGQKGIAVIVNYEDMPVAHSVHGDECIVPDMVVAMSSVVTRQTNGVLYEAARSLSVLKEDLQVPTVVNACETAPVEDEFYVTRGSTGTYFTTLIYGDNGETKRERTRATMGFIRIFNQTQMSRERHQISHIGAGKHTLRTPDGRARGGGVKWGEMEVQAASSAGLQCCDNEISARGDRIVGRWCRMCQRLGLLCVCTTEDHHIEVTAPYDLVVLDVVNAIVYNGSFQYQFTPEL